jgi:hypothetical protein
LVKKISLIYGWKMIFESKDWEWTKVKIKLS